MGARILILMVLILLTCGLLGSILIRNLKLRISLNDHWLTCLCGFMVCVTCVWSVIFDTNTMQPIKFLQDLLELHVFLKGSSHSAIGTAIYLSELMGCMIFSVIVKTVPCDPCIESYATHLLRYNDRNRSHTVWTALYDASDQVIERWVSTFLTSSLRQTSPNNAIFVFSHHWRI